MNPCQINNLTILRLLHGILRKICHLNVGPIMSCISYYKKKVVTPFKSRLQIINTPFYLQIITIAFSSSVVQFDIVMNSTYKLVLVPSFNSHPQTLTFILPKEFGSAPQVCIPFQNCENIIYLQYHLTNLKVLHKA